MAVLLGSLVKYLNGRCNARVLLRSPEFPLSFPFWLLFDSVWFLSSPVISADRYRRIFFLFYTRHSDNEALGFLTGRKRLREGVGHCCIEPIELFFYIINLTIEARRKRGRDAYKQKRLWVIDVQVTRCLTAADPRQPFSPQLKHKHLNFRLSNMNINRGSFYRDARNGIFWWPRIGQVLACI